VLRWAVHAHDRAHEIHAVSDIAEKADDYEDAEADEESARHRFLLRVQV
jgi:hypothetical protein